MKTLRVAAAVLQSTLIAGSAGVILALAGGIIYTAVTGELAPWLEWIDRVTGLRCVNYW